MMYSSWNVSLNDFASRNQLNKIIAENMINVPMLQEGVGSFEEKAYFCFYNAYKICYDLTFNGSPSKWKIPDYLKQSHYGSNNKDLVTIMQSVTMSIVVILLEHCNFPPTHPIIEVIDAIEKTIKGMFIHGENDGFVSAEIIQSLRPTECIKVSRTLYRGTNIDYKIDIIEFSSVSNKSIDEYFQNKIDEAVKKAVDEIPVLNAEFKGNTLYLNQVPRKEIDAQKTTSQKSVPDDNLQQQLADAQKTIEEQTQTISEQQEELKRLTTLNEVLTKQNARFNEENPEMDIDEETALSIKESIIFFSSIMGCNLNKEDISQMNLARLISKFTQWPKESIRPKIVDINTERENNAKDHTAFSDGVHQAAVNVCALIENAMEGLNKNPLPYSCKQAVENIRNIYKSSGRKIELHEIAEAKKSLKKI